MALTGLQIQKLLPKTNCRECGSSTCLAFAMKVAARKAELSQCPYASDEAKRVLGAASEPPVRTVRIGKAEAAVALGGETVLYRHEKTFVNRTALGVNLNDTDSDDHIATTLQMAREYVFERVGEQMRLDVLAVTQVAGGGERFLAVLGKVKDSFDGPVVVRTSDLAAMSNAAALLDGTGAVLFSPDCTQCREVADLARKHRLVAAITARDLGGLSRLASEVRQGGCSDLLLAVDGACLAERFQSQVIARRAAIRESVRGLGLPFLRFVDATDILGETTAATLEITKYGGICVLPRFEPAQLSALMTLRLNIFTDPQKPIQVEPKAYPIGEPGPDAPVFVTTNFSLTYFVVSGEIENSGASAWLLVPECEGMSVLTAWAAGKLTAQNIAKALKEAQLEKALRSRCVVLPGYVAQLSGELQECAPGWKVMVGPPEAADIEDFVKRGPLAAADGNA